MKNLLLRLEIAAELPLQKTWTLVPEDIDGV